MASKSPNWVTKLPEALSPSAVDTTPATTRLATRLPTVHSSGLQVSATLNSANQENQPEAGDDCVGGPLHRCRNVQRRCRRRGNCAHEHHPRTANEGAEIRPPK